jgi:type II secretory pathway component GspD/PulD (secretin)
MKTSHLKIVSTYALAAWCLIALGIACARAQDSGTSNHQPVYAPIDLSTNPPADTNAAAGTDASANATPATNSVAPDAAAAVPAATPAAPAEPAAPAVTVAPAEPAAPAVATAPAVSNTDATTPANVVIPTIVMDEVPLTDAIKNLARQAGLNYILDPKVSFGPPGADGKSAVPNISIRWENVTATQALTTLLTTYGLQLVEDPKTQIARITVRDPAAPEPLLSKIIQLKYASPSNMLAAVQTALVDKRSKVMGDVRTSQLVILATEKEIESINKMVESLDTQTKQVLIEVRMLETRINPTSIKGVDWTGTLTAQHVTFGNNALPGLPPQAAVPPVGSGGTIIPGTPASPGTIGGILNGIGAGSGVIGSAAKGSFFQPATAFLNADGLSVVLSFLNSDAETKILSSPRTVTLDNETAHIEVGTQYPVINVTAGTANTTGGSQISYSNLTTRLDVTPRISANNFINLKVTPRAMRLQQVQRFTAGSQSFDVPVFDTRSIDTTVMIPSGNTLVMGGLMEDDVTKQNTKVPLLGDIPGFGLLFRKDSKSRVKSNLIIFITPTVVGDEDYQPTKSEFLHTSVPTSDSVDKKWSAWDSGKPRDWSKLQKDANFPESSN